MTYLYDFGIYEDKIITVPAETELKKGAVLGEVTGTNKLAPYSSDSGSNSKNPDYILVKGKGLKNETSSAVDFTAKVLVSGQCNAYALSFINSADSVETAGFLTTLKKSGIIARKMIPACEDL